MGIINGGEERIVDEQRDAVTSTLEADDADEDDEEESDLISALASNPLIPDVKRRIGKTLMRLLNIKGASVLASFTVSSLAANEEDFEAVSTLVLAVADRSCRNNLFRPFFFF
jgi:hypothetical protein